MTIYLSLILPTTRIQKQFPLSVFFFIDSFVVSAYKTPVAIHAISCQNNLELHLPYLLIELFYIGIPVVRTDGRSGSLSVYGQVITKFSRMGRLLHFLYPWCSAGKLRARAPLLVYSRLPITRTFKGNRKRFELSGTRKK